MHEKVTSCENNKFAFIKILENMKIFYSSSFSDLNFKMIEKYPPPPILHTVWDPLSGNLGTDPIPVIGIFRFSNRCRKLPFLLTK